MWSTSPRFRSPDRGFSLLEMVVAMSILSLSLAALYQAASGATRNVRSDEKYAYGVELARSLLADHSYGLTGGGSEGETAGGFSWRVDVRPLADFGKKESFGLQEIRVVVSWADGFRQRQVQLDSVVEGAGP